MRSSNGNGGLGAVTWREHYTPFGEKTLAAGANADNLGYTGHVQE